MADANLGRRTPRLLTPDVSITGAASLDATIGDLWAWMGSDVLSNSQRGVLAEFAVARLLGDARPVREEWAPFDVRTPSGTTVEVKASAYVQSWMQKRLSRISFSIRPSRTWNPDTGKFDGERRRQADVYVFCLHGHKDKDTVDPLDLEQWRFYAVATARLPDGATMGLAALEDLAMPVRADELRTAVELERHPLCEGG